MAADNSAPDDLGESDHDKLRRLFSALLDALLREVTKPDVKASILEVARMFLRQNHIIANRPTDLQSSLASLKDMPFSS